MRSATRSQLPSSKATNILSDPGTSPDEGYYSTLDGKMTDITGAIGVVPLRLDIIAKSCHSRLVKQSKRSSTDTLNGNSSIPKDGADGLEILGRDSKRLVQGIQDLRHLGIEDIVVPLPKIVVVGGCFTVSFGFYKQTDGNKGDQSTGKSSLIEGMR